MHAADGEDDILGADAMQPRDGFAKFWVALGAGIAECELAEVGQVVRCVVIRRDGWLKQFPETNVRPEAFAEVVARRRADQGDDLAFQKSRHPALRHLAWLAVADNAARRACMG